MRSVIELEIQQGSHQGRATTVTGSPFVIGSGFDCDWVLEDDRLGREHFQISLEDELVWVKSLVSDGPVLLNGRRVAREALNDLDVIQAGEQQIRVRITGAAADSAAPTASPLPIVEPPTWRLDEVGLYHILESETRPTFRDAPERPMFGPPPAKTGGRLSFAAKPDFRSSHPRGQLYCLIDSARGFETAFGAHRQGHDLVSLFMGPMARDMLDAAPYFFAVEASADFLTTWSARLGSSLGILLDSPADPAALFHHLREIFVVQDQTGQEFFFRYYDPRVLRTFLPTCTSAELADLFGPITALIVEDEEGDGYELHRRDSEGRLETTRLGAMQFED